MRILFLSLSMVLFVFSEIAGLLQGMSTVALHTRSLAIFFIFFLLGQGFSYFFEKTRHTEDEEGLTDITTNVSATALDGDAAKKEEVRLRAAGNPKQAAHVINTLIQ